MLLYVKLHGEICTLKVSDYPSYSYCAELDTFFPKEQEGGGTFLF